MTVHCDEHFKIWGVEIIGFGWKPSNPAPSYWIVPIRSLSPWQQRHSSFQRQKLEWYTWLNFNHMKQNNEHEYEIIFFRALYALLSLILKRHIQWTRKKGYPFCNPVPDTQLDKHVVAGYFGRGHGLTIVHKMPPGVILNSLFPLGLLYTFWDFVVLINYQSKAIKTHGNIL